MRVVSGVILGYLVFGLSALALFRITHHNPHAPASISFEVCAIVYGILFAMLAGYIASFIGGRRDMLAARITAIVVALIAVASMIASAGIAWSQVAAVVLMAPAVLIGGWWYVVCSRAKVNEDHRQ